MMTHILIYFSSVIALLFLPERAWVTLWNFLMDGFERAKKLKQKIPWGKTHKKGEELLNYFPQIEARFVSGLNGSDMTLPQYKFYTPLLFKLFEAHRKLGISLKIILPELRQNLIKDLQFEKKVLGQTIGGNLQCAVIALTTWSFIFFSSALIDLPVKLSNLIFIGLLQFLGVIVFNFSLQKIKRHLFSKFNQAIERLYLFVSLSEIGLSVGQVLDESRVLKGNLMGHKVFLPCARRLETLVFRWKENGLSPKNEAQEITRELWYLKELDFERFLKYLELLKFIVLAFFFLPAYFLYLYSIFQFFMEQ